MHNSRFVPQYDLLLEVSATFSGRAQQPTGDDECSTPGNSTPLLAGSQTDPVAAETAKA